MGGESGTGGHTRAWCGKCAILVVRRRHMWCLVVRLWQIPPPAACRGGHAQRVAGRRRLAAPPAGSCAALQPPGMHEAALLLQLTVKETFNCVLARRHMIDFTLGMVIRGIAPCRKD